MRHIEPRKPTRKLLIEAMEERRLMATIDLTTLRAPQGTTIVGKAQSQSGWSVSGVGDINGDGLDDSAVGAPFRSVGESYVLFGRAAPVSSVNLATLGSAGLTIRAAIHLAVPAM